MRRGGAAVLLAACLAVAVGGCAGIPTNATYPPPDVTVPPAGDATAAAQQAVKAALGNVGLVLSDAHRSYRPPEGAILAAAPRTVVQVNLPDDPAHGFISIYALGTPEAASRAAADQAAYIASNPGRVQFPSDARFTLRVLGSVVIFSWWSPGSSPDQRAPRIEEALRTLGVEVPVAA